MCAYLRGELELPSVKEMERSIETIRDWKRANINFENARSCVVSMRFQQHIDIVLKELQVSPYRKLPNPFAELFSRYEVSDYKGVYEEYERAKAKQTAPFKNPSVRYLSRAGWQPANTSGWQPDLQARLFSTTHRYIRARSPIDFARPCHPGHRRRKNVRALWLLL